MDMETEIFDGMFRDRELKRRKDRREKDARKAAKGPAPEKKGTAAPKSAAANEDDLNPNVCFP